MRQQAIAHVRQMPDGVWKEHALLNHLKEVSRIADEFAEGFRGKDWASLASLWPSTQTAISSSTRSKGCSLKSSMDFSWRSYEGVAPF